MSALIKNHENQEVLPRQIIDKAIWNTLKNSIYPGAKDDSIMMVLDYCKAKGLDPLQKPVHIVPMSVKDSKTGKYEYRDVIMPGIGSYRTDASRTGLHAGTSEPEFGEDVTEELAGVKVTYPKWCKVTVKKLDRVTGDIFEFAAKEIWKENYATAGKDTVSPNNMWKKRAYGQLAKCAEAQALRKAFPDSVPNQPTAEEMEGKTIEHEQDYNKLICAPVNKGMQGLKQVLNIDPDENKKILDPQESEFTPPVLASSEKISELRNLCFEHGFTEERLIGKSPYSCFEEMSPDEVQERIDYITSKIYEDK